ncbi:MAG: cyclophilin-like family protein [Pseudomonadota bacterium]|nr:cyclophilin-like family protein [Pseudomonadota bacterium]
MQKRCKICIKKFEIIVDLRNTKTAEILWQSLPIISSANTWGDEVYFYTSINAEIESDAKEIMEFGEIAFWPSGKAIAIGFGKTPVSIGNEIRLAAKCNVWGKTDFDLKELKGVKDGDQIKVIRV